MAKDAKKVTQDILMSWYYKQNANKKAEFFKGLEGSFYCYCYALNKSPFKNDKKYVDFFNELDNVSI